MAYFTGKSGYLDAGGTTVNVTSWTAEATADLSETSHSGSSGLKTFVVGLRGLTGTVELNWDAASNPQTNPPNLVDGQTISSFVLYLESGQGNLDVDNAMINSVSYTTPVDGNVTISVSWTATGSWTAPAGNW